MFKLGQVNESLDLSFPVCQEFFKICLMITYMQYHLVSFLKIHIPESHQLLLNQVPRISFFLTSFPGDSHVQKYENYWTSLVPRSSNFTILCSGTHTQHELQLLIDPTPSPLHHLPMILYFSLHLRLEFCHPFGNYQLCTYNMQSPLHLYPNWNRTCEGH